MTKAIEARDKTKETEEVEKVMIAIAGSIDNNGNINIQQLNDNLEDIVQQYEEITELPSIIVINEQQYVINGRGNLIKLITREIAESDEMLTNTENIALKDEYENIIIVPAGFKVSSDSAMNVEDGIVIEDKKGNQFVWIPAKTEKGMTVNTSLGNKEIIYKRFDFGINDGDFKNYFEDLSNDEKISVDSNGGYYIGRYECGDKVTTELNRMRINSDSQENEISIKRGQAPYDMITYENSKILAEKFDEQQGYKAMTKLMSSYAWDTAISFIQIKNIDYGLNSEEGNYTDLTFDYIDIEGNQRTKNSGEAVMVPTGETKPVSNIYDMGGNLWERTTEKCVGERADFSTRGGYYNWNNQERPAGCRSDNYGAIYKGYGFRVSLYI